MEQKTAPDPRRERFFGIVQIWLLAALLLLVFILGLFLRPATPIDETRYLSVAWEMHLSGDYFVPTKNGETYAHKPPLLFWLINLVWALTGVTETGARLVGPLFAVANLPLAASLARRLFPDVPRIAPMTAAIVASLVVYGLYSGLTMFDAMLATATLVFLTGVWMALRENRWKGWLLCGAALGFGVLAKGPVILVYTLPVVLLSNLWRLPEIKAKRVALGALAALGVGLAITAAWLVPAVITGGEAYREELLWKQTAGRVANAFAHGRPFWFFLALLPIYLFPWSLNWDTWKSLRRLDLKHPGIRLLGIQVLGALLAFSVIESKQAHYLVPVLPVLAILLASILSPDTMRTRNNFGIIIVAIAAVAAAAWVYASNGSLADLWAPRSYAFGAALLLSFAIATALILQLRPSLAPALWTLLLLTVVNIWIAVSWLGKAHDMHEFTKNFAGRDGSEIAYFGRPYHAEFNFIGRLSEPVHEAASREDLLAWAAAHPEGLVIAPRATFETVPRVGVIYGKRSYGLWEAGKIGE